jgi:LysM repeat protein
MKRLLVLSLVIAILCLNVSPTLAAPTADTFYTVKAGDTLFAIALKFGTTVSAIMQANNLSSTLIFVGQTLKIPTGSSSGGTSGGSTSGGTSGGTPGVCGSSYVVKPGDTLGIIANKCGVSASAIVTLNGLVNINLIFVGQTLKLPGTTVVNNPPPVVTPIPTTTPAPTTGGSSKCPAIYTIQRGDTLGIIAAKCGVTAQAILANNTLPNPNLIYVGQQLSIPGGQGAGTVPPAPPTSNPPPAATPTPAPGSVGNTHGLVGTLTLCNPEKPSFAANIERICFHENLFNPTGGSVQYGILGVQATNLTGGPNQFQTSWRGDDLFVPAGGNAPGGGNWEDGIYITTPGTYRLQLAVCFNTVDACLAGSGWETLTAGVNVVVVFWLP